MLRPLSSNRRAPVRTGFKYTVGDIENGLIALRMAHDKLGIPHAWPLTPPYDPAKHAPRSVSANSESGYCLACHSPKEFEIEKDEQYKTGSRRRSGKCPDCGATISVFRPASSGSGSSASRK